MGKSTLGSIGVSGTHREYANIYANK